jgi:Exostosin family
MFSSESQTPGKAPAVKSVCLIFLTREALDIANLFESAFRNLGVATEVVRLPYFTMRSLTTSRLKKLRELIDEKSKNSFVVFCPESTELFLRNVGCHITFSAYRSWVSEFPVSVIPHLWTPYRMPFDPSALIWVDKPPLRLGFMGRSHSASVIATIAGYLPIKSKQRLLRGAYLKHPSLLALAGDVGLPLANLNAFARVDTLHAVQPERRNISEIEVDITERNFRGSTNEVDLYAAHLRNNTYIVCPRGVENYSYRMYEALNSGRIPVIIDTDMILPDQIDWRSLALIVPFDSLDQLHEIIMEDYQTRSAEEFIERQRQAFSTMSKLNQMLWIKDLTQRIVAKI